MTNKNKNPLDLLKLIRQRSPLARVTAVVDTACSRARRGSANRSSIINHFSHSFRPIFSQADWRHGVEVSANQIRRRTVGNLSLIRQTDETVRLDFTSTEASLLREKTLSRRYTYSAPVSLTRGYDGWTARARPVTDKKWQFVLASNLALSATAGCCRHSCQGRRYASRRMIRCRRQKTARRPDAPIHRPWSPLLVR